MAAINGTPASYYDGSHISKAARATIGKLSEDKAVRILLVADRDTVDRPTRDEHLARISAGRYQ
jgi:hypothetical protein